MDRHTPEQRRKNMQAVKAEGSKIERILSKALWDQGYRYRKNYSGIDGKPDIAFTGKKVAIFCDSEFWHGRDWETLQKTIKTNRAFWINKIEGNIKRDKEVNRSLRKKDWIVLRFWGKDITKNVEKCVKKIEKEMNK